MNCRDIPQVGLNSKCLKLWVLIGNTIFSKCFFHIKRSSKSFPYITTSMFIKFFIPGKNFVNGLFLRNMESIDMISDNIGDINGSCFFSQFSNYILLIFPPFNLVFHLEMEIIPIRTVKLSYSSVNIHLHSGLS